MRAIVACTLAALLCAGGARAQERRAQPAQDREKKEPPLSKEDAEVVKQLALLEKLDLVRNLDLFQPEKEEPRQPQRQP